MALRNHIDFVEDTATEFAEPTNSTSRDTLKGISALAAQANVTVTTPAAKAFEPADVNVTDNTITETAHGFKRGLKGQFTTTGGLPAGLSAATDYFVIVVDANTYKVATSLANAQAGTAVDITTQGTGTHTFTPTSIAGASAKLQKSLDGTNWFDETSAQNITATGSLYFEKVDPTGKYYRLAYTLTAGQISVTNRWLGKGPSN